MKNRVLQIIIISIGIILIVKLWGDIRRLLGSSNQVKLVQQGVEELEKENRQLQEKKKYYQSEEFIEEEARNKLNMAKPGETIVILPQNFEDLINKDKNESSSALPNWKKWLELFF